MAKGVVFKTEKDGPPTAMHKDVLNKVKATATIVGGKVELSFTIIFKDAELIEKPDDLTQKAFWPFIDGTYEIDLKNPETHLDQKKHDKPASFQLTVDWPDGKIGGAEAWKLIEAKEKEEEYLK